jgi:uncharacterized membrane protein
MLNVDNPPLVLLGIIILVFVAPFIYSFFVDNYDKRNKQIKSSEQ